MNLITGRLYKPNRTLYYMEPSEKEKEDFYLGNVPDVVKKYEGEFGTYDAPGLFRVGDMEVIGIEYRPDDERINYPKELKMLNLRASFMISVLLADEDYASKESIWEKVEWIKDNMAIKAFHNDIVPQKNPEVIQVTTRNKATRFYVTAKEITKEEYFDYKVPVTETEKALEKVAYYDVITGHHNWNHIWPVIIGYGLVGIQDFQFVHFDIKDFNAINIVYGHDAANDALCHVVEHMNEADWIYHSARCDNDNFAMMIKDMPEEETKQKLMEFFDGISTLRIDKNYHIYYRCGVVPMRNTIMLGDVVADAGKQVQHMGNRLYKTEILFYTDSMRDELEWSSKIKAYLDTAIENDEFLVYLQPKYDINTETLHGAEALIRWKYHGKELLSPGRFVPVFETGGLISKLDDIVLNKVCGYIKKWKEEGKPVFPISVNLSRKRMANPNLVEYLTSIVDSYGIDHNLIDFELTESAAYDNQKYMLKVINDLKSLGFRISMDDFGTGYSSLALLTVMPMDTLKIDKSFVDGIDYTKEAENYCSVVRSIISMAKELGFTCLAEGAEEKKQVDLLRRFGCDIVQGYYYSKPLPVEEYEQKLDS